MSDVSPAGIKACPKCGKLGNIIVRQEYLGNPEFLIISFPGNNINVGTPPFTLPCDNEFSYGLTGVVLGRPGHYISATLNTSRNVWILHDGTSHIEMPLMNVFGSGTIRIIAYKKYPLPRFSKLYFNAYNNSFVQY